MTIKTSHLSVRSLLIASLALGSLWSVSLAGSSSQTLATNPKELSDKELKYYLTRPILDARIPVDEFLAVIGYIESKNGKYTNHRLITSGIHKGSRAVGTYGLMPNTIREVAGKHKIARHLRKKSDYEIHALLKKYPRFERKIVRLLALDILEKTNGNFDKAAYMWLMGSNMDPLLIPERLLNGSSYVLKFRKYLKVLRKHGRIA